MRELKYFVKGTRGNIEVSKGTYLCLQKKLRIKKVDKGKQIQGSGRTEKANKKIIVKKENAKTSNKRENLKCNKNHCTPVSMKELQKKYLTTVDSKQANPNNSEDVLVSEFELFQTNQTQNQLHSSSRGHFQEGWATCQQNDQKNVQLTQSKLQSQKMFLEEEVQNQVQLEEYEESSWSMINENVEFMAMSLSMAIYDQRYGRSQ